MLANTTLTVMTTTMTTTLSGGRKLSRKVTRRECRRESRTTQAKLTALSNTLQSETGHSQALACQYRQGKEERQDVEKLETRSSPLLIGDVRRTFCKGRGGHGPIYTVWQTSIRNARCQHRLLQEQPQCQESKAGWWCCWCLSRKRIRISSGKACWSSLPGLTMESSDEHSDHSSFLDSISVLLIKRWPRYSWYLY